MWLDDHPDNLDVSAGREMLAALREGFDDQLAPPDRPSTLYVAGMISSHGSLNVPSSGPITQMS